MALQSGNFGNSVGRKSSKSKSKPVDPRTLKRVGSVMASMQKPKKGGKNK